MTAVPLARATEVATEPTVPTAAEPSPPDQLTGDFSAVLARLNRASTRLARLPVAAAQARLLAQIDDLGRPRLGDVAIADGCTQPTMSTQVRRLEAAGWVSRERDVEDARAVRLSVTGAGSRLLEELRAIRTTALAPHLAALSEAEYGALVAALPALQRLAESMTQAAGQE